MTGVPSSQVHFNVKVKYHIDDEITSKYDLMVYF